MDLINLGRAVVKLNYGYSWYPDWQGRTTAMKGGDDVVGLRVR